MVISTFSTTGTSLSLSGEVGDRGRRRGTKAFILDNTDATVKGGRGAESIIMLYCIAPSWKRSLVFVQDVMPHNYLLLV